MKKLMLLVSLFVFSGVAMAAERPENATNWMLFAYFIAMGLAAFGGTQGQSKAASAALEGIARNPGAADKIQTPMILSFAFMESLVIFTLLSIFFV